MNLHDPHDLTTPLATAPTPVPVPVLLPALLDPTPTFGALEAPVNAVFRKSQDVNILLEHTLSGIGPTRLGLDVRESDVSDKGRDVGGAFKSLLVRYLLVSAQFLVEDKIACNVCRDAREESEGIVPEKELYDKSLFLLGAVFLHVLNSSQIRQRSWQVRL